MGSTCVSQSWSNVPDYMAPVEFLQLAAYISSGAPPSQPTKHHMHTMNWVRCVKGTSHVDLCLANDRQVRGKTNAAERGISCAWLQHSSIVAGRTGAALPYICSECMHGREAPFLVRTITLSTQCSLQAHVITHVGHTTCAHAATVNKTHSRRVSPPRCKRARRR
jgi:hypothetical protein